MLITSATSRSVSGLRYSMPFSKKSRCRSTMKFITLSIVWRRCSIAWIIQLALFIRGGDELLVLGGELLLVARDLLVGPARAGGAARRCR